jgi:hypothetical protein
MKITRISDLMSEEGTSAIVGLMDDAEKEMWVRQTELSKELSGQALKAAKIADSYDRKIGLLLTTMLGPIGSLEQQ